jgi:hypothetical protein
MFSSFKSSNLPPVSTRLRCARPHFPAFNPCISLSPAGIIRNQSTGPSRVSRLPRVCLAIERKATKLLRRLPATRPSRLPASRSRLRLQKLPASFLPTYNTAQHQRPPFQPAIQVPSRPLIHPPRLLTLDRLACDYLRAASIERHPSRAAAARVC